MVAAREGTRHGDHGRTVEVLHPGCTDTNADGATPIERSSRTGKKGSNVAEVFAQVVRDVDEAEFVIVAITKLLGYGTCGFLPGVSSGMAQGKPPARKL